MGAVDAAEVKQPLDLADTAGRWASAWLAAAVGDLVR
jgi:hypothetical protein